MVRYCRRIVLVYLTFIRMGYTPIHGTQWCLFFVVHPKELYSKVGWPSYHLLSTNCAGVLHWDFCPSFIIPLNDSFIFRGFITLPRYCFQAYLSSFPSAYDVNSEQKRLQNVGNEGHLMRGLRMPSFKSYLYFMSVDVVCNSVTRTLMPVWSRGVQPYKCIQDRRQPKREPSTGLTIDYNSILNGRI